MIVRRNFICLLLAQAIFWGPVWVLLPRQAQHGQALADREGTRGPDIDYGPFVRFHPRTGTIAFRQTDLALEGISPLFAFVRSHGETGTERSIWGNGWSSNLDQVLVPEGEGFVHVRAGERTRFEPAGEGRYRAASGRPRLLYRKRQGFRLVQGPRQWSFDGKGRLSGMRAAGRSPLKIVRDDRGRPVHCGDSHGNTIQFAYAGGRIAEVSDHTGRRVAFRHDPGGELLEARSSGMVWTYRYRRGRLVRVREGEGTPLLLGYDDAGRPATIRGPGFPDRTFHYLKSGDDLTVQVRESGRSLASHTFSEEGRRETIMAPSGQVREILYDRRGLPARIQMRVRGRIELQIRMKYDREGNLALLEEGSRSFRFEHDTEGRIVGITDPAGARLVYRYDSRGNLVSFGTPSRIVRLVNDRSGRPIEASFPGGAVFRYRYGQLGLFERIEGPYGLVARFERNRLGQLISWTDFSGEEYRLGYDPGGRLVTVTYPFGASVRLKYTPNGRLAGWSREGLDLAVRYDRNGRPAGLEDPLRETKTAVGRDALGQVRTVRGWRGETFRYMLDPEGRRTAFADPLGNLTRMRRDSLGNLAGVVHPDGKTLEIVSDSRGAEVEYRHPDGTREIIVRDPMGRIKELKGPGCHQVRRYDREGRVVAIEDRAAGHTVRIGYDDAGRKAVVEGPGGTVRYHYDLLGQLESVGLPSGKVLYVRDKLRRLSERRFPGGVREKYAWNRSRREGIAVESPSGKPLLDLRYRFDDVMGLISEVQDRVAGVTSRYRYDSWGQLARIEEGESTRVLKYDLSGNRTSSTYKGATTSWKTDQANRVLSAGEVSYRHDRRGNLVEKREGSRVTRYRYDARNRLVGVDLPGGGSVAYGYAPDGTRIWRESGGVRTRFLSDGDNLVATLRNGKLVAWWAHHPWTDEPLARFSGQSCTYYHADLSRNIRLLTGAAGKAQASYRYDPFGNRVGEQAAVDQPFGFASREWDPEVGLNFHRARYYSPELGRFLSPDPAGLSAGLNLYLYCHNNPVNFVDVDGRAILQALGAGIGGLIGGGVELVSQLASGEGIDPIKLAVETFKGAATGGLITSGMPLPVASLIAGGVGAVAKIALDALKGNIGWADLADPYYWLEVAGAGVFDALLTAGVGVLFKALGPLVKKLGGRIGKAFEEGIEGALKRSRSRLAKLADKSDEFRNAFRAVRQRMGGAFDETKISHLRELQKSLKPGSFAHKQVNALMREAIPAEADRLIKKGADVGSKILKAMTEGDRILVARELVRKLFKTGAKDLGKKVTDKLAKKLSKEEMESLAEGISADPEKLAMLHNLSSKLREESQLEQQFEDAGRRLSELLEAQRREQLDLDSTRNRVVELIRRKERMAGDLSRQGLKVSEIRSNPEFRALGEMVDRETRRMRERESTLEARRREVLAERQRLADERTRIASRLRTIREQTADLKRRIKN